MRRRPWRLIAAVITAALLVAVLLVTLGFRIADELRTLRAASRDSVEWSIAQYEVEYLALLSALGDARAGRADLSDVRRRFDIFYSRAEIVGTSDLYAIVIADPVARRHIADVRAALEAAVPLIDARDDQLDAALATLHETMRALRPAIRAVGLTAVRLFSQMSDAQRADFQALLAQTGVVLLVLFALLALITALLVRQNRISVRRAEELRLSAQRFEQTINGSLNAIILADRNGTVLGFNPGAERTFGYQRDEALGRNIADLVVPDRLRAAHDAGMRRHRQTGEATIVGRGRVEIEAKHAKGHEFPVELSLAQTTGPDGDLYVAYCRDITERRRIERELVEARDKALAAASARAQFLAVMSHEMRTPLNGVLAVLDLLDTTPMSTQQRGYVETAIASGEILQRHIDDILDLTQIESGQMTIASEPFDLATLLNEVVAMNRHAAGARSNELTVEHTFDRLPMIGDRHRLGQVLVNLVGNAIKFTERGVICLSASVTDGATGEALTIAVRDTGIGIAHPDQGRIFDNFVTLDSTYRRKTSGYGLGLAICRRIVTAMNGSITVTSHPGYGSTFSVALPLQRADPADVPAAPSVPRLSGPALAADQEASIDRAAAASPAALSVLLVEDNATNRFVAREMLAREGCRVTEARDGAIGLALSERERFDLILMDVSMPRLDGIGATRAIREGNGLSATVPIVGLTAHALPEEMARVREAGMDDCLVKPLRTAALHALVRRLRDGDIRPVATGVAPAGGDDPIGDNLVDTSVLTELKALCPAPVFQARVAEALSELEALPDALRRLALAGDPDALRACAHNGNGLAAVLGVTLLCDILSTLEDACADSDADAIRTLIEEVTRVLPATCDALRRHTSPQSTPHYPDA